MGNDSGNYNATRNNVNLTSGSIDDGPLEKDFSNGKVHPTDDHVKRNLRSRPGYHLDNSVGSDTALRKIRTAGSISISPELFEKIYLTPQNQVKGDLRKTFGNPTPLALVGFLLSLSPLSCILMGWRGAGGSGASDIGAYFFFGGLLMILGAIGEFFLGNTFPSVVFGSFGGFWLTFGATLQPFYMTYGLYAANPVTNPYEGLATQGFNASFGFFFLFMGFLCFLYMILALRTNIVFVVIFATLSPAFCCLAGAYWHNAEAYGAGATVAPAISGKLLIAAGALTFVTDMAGWWIFFAIMLAALDFPFQLPVGDLSTMIKGASEKAKEKEDKGRYEA
ncbi:GPR1/FUN34/yaaH family-domain-containing protein [Delphinella strobiligena]|nr:GPR1/FUN34/yaaH family-domain-containing protein [Delphinella strobiligena]